MSLKDWYLSVIRFWHFHAPPMNKTWTSRGPSKVQLCFDSSHVPLSYPIVTLNVYITDVSTSWSMVTEIIVKLYRGYLLSVCYVVMKNLPEHQYICDYHQYFVYAPDDITIYTAYLIWAWKTFTNKNHMRLPSKFRICFHAYVYLALLHQLHYVIPHGRNNQTDYSYMFMSIPLKTKISNLTILP